MPISKIAAFTVVAALAFPAIAAAQVVPPGCTMVQSQDEPLHLVCYAPPPIAYYDPPAYYAPPPYYPPPYYQPPAYAPPLALVLPPLALFFRFGAGR